MPRRTTTDISAPPVPTTRRADSQAIVEAILGAASQLPVGSSVNLIADRAGVGVASLYRYFPGKEAIYAELGRRVHQDLLAECARRLGNAASLSEAVSACSQLGLLQDVGRREVLQHVHTALPFSWHAGQAKPVFAGLVAMTADTLDRFLLGSHKQLRSRAHTMVSMVRGVSRDRFLYEDLAPDEDTVLAHLHDALIACATRGLMVREPPLAAPDDLLQRALRASGAAQPGGSEAP